MKKSLVIVLTVCMALLAGCGSRNVPASSVSAPQSSSSSQSGASSTTSSSSSSSHSSSSGPNIQVDATDDYTNDVVSHAQQAPSGISVVQQKMEDPKHISLSVTDPQNTKASFLIDYWVNDQNSADSVLGILVDPDNDFQNNRSAVEPLLTQGTVMAIAPWSDTDPTDFVNDVFSQLSDDFTLPYSYTLKGTHFVKLKTGTTANAPDNDYVVQHYNLRNYHFVDLTVD